MIGFELRVARIGAVLLIVLVAGLGMFLTYSSSREPERINTIFSSEKKIGSWELREALRDLETCAIDAKFLRNGMDQPAEIEHAFSQHFEILASLIMAQDQAARQANYKYIQLPQALMDTIRGDVTTLRTSRDALLEDIQAYAELTKAESEAELAADQYKGGDKQEENRLFRLSETATFRKRHKAEDVAARGDAVATVLQETRQHLASLSEKLIEEIDLTIAAQREYALTSMLLIGIAGVLAALVSGIGLTIATRKLAQENIERRKSNDELERSNIELKQFAYIASHDLQEPLRVVAGCCQILEEDYAPRIDADGKELFKRVVGATARMQTMINDLLAYSRVETRAKPLEPVDLNMTFELAIANLQQSIDETHAVITHDQLPAILGDGSQLLQVFQNLLGNAIKFRGDETPRIHVAARLENAFWLFSVKDNGIGIEPEFHEKIFEIFKRLKSRKQYAGTGIGLAICKRVVERLGGRIWVESSLGAGSTFKFTLPVRRESNV